MWHYRGSHGILRLSNLLIVLNLCILRLWIPALLLLLIAPPGYNYPGALYRCKINFSFLIWRNEEHWTTATYSYQERKIVTSILPQGSYITVSYQKQHNKPLYLYLQNPIQSSFIQNNFTYYHDLSKISQHVMHS